MKFSKFNRNRATDPWRNYRITQNKANYLASKGKLRFLDSIHTENQSWGALHKAWKGYVIGLNKYELENMRHYAKVIQRLQAELGLTISSFPNLNIYPAKEGYSEVTYDNVDYDSEEDMKEW
jgi:hypothetical protein